MPTGDSGGPEPGAARRRIHRPSISEGPGSARSSRAHRAGWADLDTPGIPARLARLRECLARSPEVSAREDPNLKLGYPILGRDL